VTVKKISAAAIFWWGGRLWPPIVLAGTEARPTEILSISTSCWKTYFSVILNEVKDL
jgi:hypothetical protein